MTSHPVLRIGTRGSPLALAQAELVRAALARACPDLAEPGAIQVVPVTTAGDRIQDRTLAEIGGKGLFTEEIERGLLDGDLDLAVHSMKDMPTALPDGLVIGAMLEREDPRDVLLSRERVGLEALPAASVVGTAALRRRAQVLALRPDLSVVPLRGNVQTRLRKLREGEVDATLLAAAGLARLGLSVEDAGGSVLAAETMLPAVAQGAIGIECRADHAALLDRLGAIGHAETEACVGVERAFLAELDGSCRTPIAAYAQKHGGDVRLRGLLAAPDGSRVWRAELTGPLADGLALGREAGRQVRGEAGSAYPFDPA
ncbi:hydroxymethylbilane synthase [Marinivivus vitaminiproducens]|uniref:hydroxymethylbilane synthase n=1 Tax=Marinivivus vitaminiproducens TaxID=3035935 RepID=UPI00279BFA24|nr:hydroxymethylbilane synthase [Geminicoccaceae bacterium SCSIO 64248]